jgi:hypothetical protein
METQPEVTTKAVRGRWYVTVLPRSDYPSGAQMQYGTQPQYQAQAGGMMDNAPRGRRTVAITDEYGNQYNSRGDRIGHR